MTAGTTGSAAPDVSVVLPTHDRFEYLPEAVASVLNQHWSGTLEIIVVDDGSAGDPREHLPALPDNVHLVTQENRGVGAARAHGIERARAPLIAFQDDDDVWLPHKLALQCGILERHPEVGMVFSDVVAFLPDGTRSERFSTWWTDLRACPHEVVPGSDPEVLIFEPGALLHALTGVMRIFHQSSLYRRSFLDQIGGSDPRTRSCGDCIDISFRATHAGRLAYVHEPTFELRRDHGEHLAGGPAWVGRETRELLLVHQDYPVDLQRALAPWMTRYLAGMAWNAYAAGDWALARDLYGRAAAYGRLPWRSRVKRLLAGWRTRGATR